MQRVSCSRGEGYICAASGSDRQTSSCGGDSGGPWFQFRDNMEKVELVGVNAFGFDGSCGEHDKKTGLVSVAHIKDWILQHAPEFEYTDDIRCSDADNGATDKDGDGCDWYTTHDTNGDHCGQHDDSDFSALSMCCRCGGGSDTGSDTCKTIGTSGVGAGQPCVFPFTFNGMTFQECTQAGHSELWCATQTDSGGNYVAGMWGQCSCQTCQ